MVGPGMLTCSSLHSLFNCKIYEKKTWKVAFEKKRDKTVYCTLSKLLRNTSHFLLVSFAVDLTRECQWVGLDHDRMMIILDLLSKQILCRFSQSTAWPFSSKTII